MNKCGICSKDKQDLGFYSGMYCCKECASFMLRNDVIVLEGKFVIYKKDIKIRL